MKPKELRREAGRLSITFDDKLPGALFAHDLAKIFLSQGYDVDMQINDDTAYFTLFDSKTFDRESDEFVN